MYYLLGLNKDAIYFMAFSILYGCIVELCFNVWPNNVRLFSIMFWSLDWQSKWYPVVSPTGRFAYGLFAYG